MKRYMFGGWLAGVSMMLFGCAKSTADLPAVRGFEPRRYLGEWYEIARLPHRFERGLDFVRAQYSLNPDGSIRVVNSGVRDGKPRSIEGRARLKAPEQVPLAGELEVSFFRPFYSDYRIIELDPGYRYAVVTGADRDYLWILAREPQLDGAQLERLLERAKSRGFAVEKLEFPRQRGVTGGAGGANATRAAAPHRGE